MDIAAKPAGANGGAWPPTDLPAVVQPQKVITVCRPLVWPVGLMDKASASGAGDSRFESWAGHLLSATKDDMACPRQSHNRLHPADPTVNHRHVMKAIADMALGLMDKASDF